MKFRQVVMRRYGAPEVLGIEEASLSPLAEDEARVKMIAAAINHSDLEIRSGNWPILREPAFPYVPGLEMVGEVVELGPKARSVKIGDRVWTMMQGFGGVRAERDGGYAEYATVRAEVLAPLPKDRDPIVLAALGLGAVTAYGGLSMLGALEGKRIAITGATGGVGVAAVAIARALGATVVAVSRAPSEEELAWRSFDGVFDAVAGPIFRRLIDALKPGGRYAIVGAAAGGDVSFDVWNLLRDVVLAGYSTESLDGASLRRATTSILALELPPMPCTVMKLDEAARAHAGLEARTLKGRVVLVP